MPPEASTHAGPTPEITPGADPPADHSAIRVEGLSHRYGQRPALCEISFSVPPGEIFGLLGPNGGGKTTLFRILCTLLRPAQGRAWIHEHEVSRRPDAVRRLLGTVFQAPSLDGKLSVRENLRLHGWLYGLAGPELNQGIAGLLEFFHLRDRSGDRVETLSGGLVRRVDLARALLHRPQVLLLDEPSTGLDPQARRELWLLLNAVRQREGTTVLMTTHFLDEADRCDRVGILDRGRLVAVGSPDALKAGLSGPSLTLEVEDAAAVARQVAEKLHLPATVVDGRVRIEHPQAHHLVPELVEALAEAIRSLTIHRPSMEEVFVHYTGHGFCDTGA